MASPSEWVGLGPQMHALAEWLLFPKPPRVLVSCGTGRDPSPGPSLPGCSLAVETGPGTMPMGTGRSPHRQQAVHIDLPRHHQVLPQRPCSAPTQPGGAEGTPAGSRMPLVGVVLWEP